MIRIPSINVVILIGFIQIFDMLRATALAARFGSWYLPPVDHKPKPYTGTSYEEVLKNRKSFIPNFMFYNYKEPLLITEGWMQYLYDHKGNRYLDLISGISTVNCGHCHPAITKVVRQQAETLVHASTIFLNQWQSEYSKRLSEAVGPDFDSVYLCNSGGEANDYAAYIARLYTGQHKFLTLENSYHGVVGNSRSSTRIASWSSKMREGSDFHTVPWPSEYRSEYKTTDELVAAAQERLKSQIPNRKVSGFVFECIQGVGGINIHHAGYLKKMSDFIRKEYGGLIIVDEVQTGFGRIGSDFWGHRWQGIKPDIMTMAKGIGNGYPLAAVVTSKRISDKLNHLYFNTYGGGPVQSRVGIQVLRILKEEKLPENAEKVGNHLISELQKMAKNNHNIGDVRGKGLMIGIEIVKDKESKQPGTEAALQLMELFKERGLLLGRGGVFGNVLRLQPPLCMSMEDAKITLQAFEECLKQVKV